jgi:hypothetical protein
VSPLFRDVRRLSAGPIRLNLPTGSDELIYEAVVDIDLRALSGVPEFPS